MRNIFFLTLCLTSLFYLALNAPITDLFERKFLENINDSYINEIKKELGLEKQTLNQEQHQKIQTIFKQRITQLIEKVKFQKDTNMFEEKEMKDFLVVAMIAKNGIQDEFKEIALASSLFNIVYNNTGSEAFRAISHKALLSCLQKTNESRHVRSKSI